VLTKYYSCEEIEKNDMGGACSMQGEETRCIQGFGGETTRIKRPLGRPRQK
jgi:hypothetical protein